MAFERHRRDDEKRALVRVTRAGWAVRVGGVLACTKCILSIFYCNEG